MPSLTSNLYEFGEFCLDTQNRVLRRGREPLPLTPKAFEVLLVLVQNGGRLVGKDELMKAVWPDSFVEESNLTQTVFMVRKALGESPDQRYILTIQGRGYRFAVDVKESTIGRTESAGAEVLSTSVSAGTVVPEASALSAAPSDRRWYKSRWLLFAGALGIFLIAVFAPYFRVSRTPSQAAGTRLMIAVLPFENLTGDPAQDYISDGLTEEMLTQLGNLDPHHLGVIGRTSVMHYKNSQTPLDQIGRELGVQYVIEGSVRRDANDVRVTAQLIQTKDQTHVWARQYDRELDKLLPLQGEIAQEIADEIQLTLGDPHKFNAAHRTVSPSTASYEAYDLYLKGRYFWNKRTQEGFKQAAEYFQQAIAKDPNYARAYAGLSDTYGLTSTWHWGPPKQLMPKARDAAVKALELDENLAEAHTSLALIAENYDYDWLTAEKEFRRAIQLDPGYATAHQWYAECLSFQGRFDEALAESERARRLDPLSLIIATDHAAILYYARQYDRAIAQFRSVLDMDPHFGRAETIIPAYVEEGRFAEALEEIKRRLPPDDCPWTCATKAYVYGRWGQTAQAEKELAQMKRTISDPDSAFFLLPYIATGRNDQAIAVLQKAYGERSNFVVNVKVEPAFDPLRSDPRFQNLLRRIGLGQ